MNAATVFDCFCGLGGLSLGAELARLDVVGGVDADEAAVATYAQALPGKRALHHDLLIEKPRAVLRNAGVNRGDVDVLVGGPPCQPYSINNHQRGTHDMRCMLVERYLEFVSILQPVWLVLENVPGFASIEEGRFLERLLRSLRARKYETECLLLDASRFGVPQRRKRLMVLANKNPKKLLGVVRELSLQTTQPVTVGDAIADLPANPGQVVRYCGIPENDFQRLMRNRRPLAAQCHIASQLGPRNLSRIKHVPPGGNWRDIPRRLLPAGMKRAHLGDHTTRYGRLRLDQLAFTLLTKCDPHWGCYVHPSADRVITVREAARLQSIPDHVEFSATLSANYRLIGNAVPPLLARGVLEQLK